MSTATKRRAEFLLKTHRLHMGVYARIAKKLGVDASYVSRVANGQRESTLIMGSLLEELKAIATTPARSNGRS